MKKHYCEFQVFRGNQLVTHDYGYFYQRYAKLTLEEIQRMKNDWLSIYYQQHPDEPKDLTICITFSTEIE